MKDLQKNEYSLSAYSDGSLGQSRLDPTNHQLVIYEGVRKPAWEISEPVFFREGNASFSAHQGYGGLIPTTISAVAFLHRMYNPDFIIRTNVSSYWNLKALRKLIMNLPPSGLYAGVTGAAFGGLSGYLDKSRFVSGAGIIMSRDIYTKLISERDRFDMGCIDDLSIGRTFSALGIKPTEMDRIDLRHVWDVETISPEVLARNAHYRCKSEHRIGSITVRRDVSIMNRLHSMIKKGGN
jgi:hypothetical protein